MALFISFSGNHSKQVANALRAWIKAVSPNWEVYVSEASIPSGDRWFENITRHLEAADFGIYCITLQNMNSQWIHFEAGALATKEGVPICPFIMGFEKEKLTGPLTNYQARIFEKEDLQRLLDDINKKMPTVVQIKDTRDLDSQFERTWLELEASLRPIEMELRQMPVVQEAQLSDVIANALAGFGDTLSNIRQESKNMRDEALATVTQLSNRSSNEPFYPSVRVFDAVERFVRLGCIIPDSLVSASRIPQISEYTIMQEIHRANDSTILAELSPEDYKAIVAGILSFPTDVLKYRDYFVSQNASAELAAG